MKRIIFAVAVGFFFSVVAIAQAEQYTDAAGFSFTYPSSWAAYPNPATAQFPADMKSRFDTVRADLAKLNVLLLHRGKSGNAESISVNVTPEATPINEASLQELKLLTPQGSATRGIRIERLRGAIQEIGVSKAIVIEFDSRPPGSIVTLHQCQFYLSSGERTYVVTCTGLARDFDQLAPVFGQVLLSFRMDGGGR
jgi:hypothetical protein